MTAKAITCNATGSFTRIFPPRSICIPKAASFTLAFTAAPDADMRRYNRPQGEQLAVVFESSDRAPHGTRDLLVWPRRPDTPILRISARNDNIDPLTYALLFPFGTPG